MAFDIYLPKEYLDATLMVSCLSVWVLIGLFTYLNRYTQRRYLSVWTAAWLFYALWLTLNFHWQGGEERPEVVMAKLCCVSACASLLIWGSAIFLEIRTRQTLISGFLVFLVLWCYVGAYQVDDPIQSSVPIFLLLAVASLVTAGAFLKLRRRSSFVGAGLLSFGFLVWGVQLGAFPFLLTSSSLVCTGFLSAAVIQLFIAVSMIVLMLEEVRAANESVQQQLRIQRSEKEVLSARVVTTEERYRSLFEQASEGIIICDVETLTVIELNPTAELLLGLSRSDPTPHTLADFCKHPAVTSMGEPGHENLASALLKKDQAHLLRRDGKEVLVELNGSLINFDGKPAYQFFVRELTERVRLEQQLRQAEKLSALGCMISGIAHELNNPLTVVRGYLELILARHELQPITRADLEKVARESNRAAKLVSNFLSVAREQTLNAGSANLNDLIRAVIEPRSIDLQNAGVELELALSPNIPSTQVDSDQVQQVLINLFTNALQAMADTARPRRLKISTSHKSELVQVRVEDSGPGVPSHLRSRIFEPFFTTKAVGLGTGLGLSIVHSILLSHKGQIAYETSCYGGAGFVLSFPELKTAVAEVVSSEVDTAVLHLSNAPRVAKSARILILDDEKSIGEMLGEMLRMLGHEPTLCHSAPQAIDLIETEKFELILSDYRMPMMDGQEFYQQICKRHPEMARRVAFLSGDVVSDETQVFLKASARPHLAKPFRLDHVSGLVAQMLAEADSGRENVVPVTFEHVPPHSTRVVP